MVPSRSWTPVGDADQGKPGVGRGAGAGDSGAAVGRAVVDHDDLQVGASLSGDRGQAVTEQILVVVERHDDADPRHGYRASSAPPDLARSLRACYSSAARVL